MTQEKKSTSHPDQRRSRRQPPKPSAKTLAFRNWLGLGPNIALRLLDISESGARLLLSENLQEGHEFEIQFTNSFGKPVKLIAKVVWSITTADGQFVVGVQFQKTLSYADWQALSRW